MSADITSYFTDNRVTALREVHIPTGAKVTTMRQVRFIPVLRLDINIQNLYIKLVFSLLTDTCSFFQAGHFSVNA